MAKTVLIPQTTFSATERVEPENYFVFSLGSYKIKENTINVMFDGETYSANDVSDSESPLIAQYGANLDSDPPDFGVYPFSISSVALSPLPDAEWKTDVYVQDANEHTIEVYIGEDEEQGGGNMPNSKITGKTFEEMLAASTQLDLSAKFKDYIYEFTNDVHAMGEVIYVHEEGDAKILFKDADLKKPVTDYELLAMYLSEVVPVQLTDENKALQRFELLTSEKLHFLEYKDSSVTKRFYQIGDYFSGEAYKDLMGFVPGNPPKAPYAVVGTAIVGTDVVAPSENSAA